LDRFEVSVTTPFGPTTRWSGSIIRASLTLVLR
jgi:hypothetical protein